MARPALLVLILSLAASADEMSLKEFFDPAARAFRLPAIEEAEFARLDVDAQRAARGFAPGEYFEPPKYADSIPQAQSPRNRLYPGFAYATRLNEKRRFWRIAARDVAIREQLRWMEALPLPGPAAFVGAYGQLTAGIDGTRRDPRQALLALRHSERQFRRWWVDELGRIIRAAPPAARRAAIRTLSGTLRHREEAVRLAAARILGALDDAEARRIVERGIERLDDAELRGALVRARARQGGDAVRTLLAVWIDDPEPAIQRAAIAALRADRLPWSLNLLQDRIATAEGRRFEDLEAAITARNGAAPDFDGPVDFYGLKTRSRRLVFCIDVSLSMDFPMDGYGGKREPRRARTLRELTRTLERLPEAVEFNVILFSRRVTPLWKNLRPADAANRAAALTFVRKAGTEPGTDVWAAVDAALRSGADTAFLLGDGEPSTGWILDPALILHEAAARNEDGHLRIHAVGLSRDQNTELLFNLARCTGGQFAADR